LIQECTKVNRPQYGVIPPHLLPNASWPLWGATPVVGAEFINPRNHAGVDLYLSANAASAITDARLTTSGICLYAGLVRNHHPGLQAIIRHGQPDGAGVLSLYNNLASLADLQLFSDPVRTFVLHFSIAYNTAWETNLQRTPGSP